jgi:cytochrome c oxidase assembly factor CtaG
VDTISDEYLQSVHMLQHVLLGVVAPPLLVLGISPAMAARLQSVRLWSWLTGLVPAQLFAAAVMIGWHLPPLYDLTLQSEAVHICEHLTFIAAGAVFWCPVIESTGAQARRSLGGWGKVVYLLVGTIAQDGVSLALMFSRVPFYDFYTHAPRLSADLSPVIDQNLAGVLLMVVGKTSFAVAIVALFARMISADRRTEALSTA